MASLFSSIFRRSTDGSPRGGVSQRLLMLMAVGVAFMCVLVYSVTDSPIQSVYRMVWVLFCALAVTFYYSLGHRRGELTQGRAFLCMLAILSQMFTIYLVNSVWPALPGVELWQKLLVLPYMLAPAVAAVLINRSMGVYMALCCTLFGVVLFPVTYSAQFLADYVLISLLTGVMSAGICGHLRKRQQILYAGFKTGAVVLGVTLALASLHKGAESPFLHGVGASQLVTIVLMAFGVNFLLAVIVNGLMPMLESLFRISTHITWLEWADMNHPLLKKLQITAPGTFHHSLYVQRLAEAAAEAIGADVTRAGVCGLYHDIGKVKNPQYFSENIVDQTMTPHAELTPEASARIITGHVTEGVQMARSMKLNPRIIDVIREHHGVTTAYFFYRKALDHYEEARKKFDEGLADTCPDEVDKSIFTYPGPIPQSRESGIVSMADAVESATRSLQHPTEEDIRNMIEGIFKGRILDGHLQDSGLTLGEIACMKESFFNTLRTMNHNRIAYPKQQAADAASLLAEKRSAEDKAADK
ncbi:MAG: HDIG domain-containing protein [Akkermansia sp.]|nr:HDIG domain-containing protein [Akkermansia sp.]